MTTTPLSDALSHPVSLRRGTPLTAMQRSLWTSQRRNPTAPLQNMALVSHLDGPVDLDRLVDAFAAVVRASDVLRSTIAEDDGASTVVVGGAPAVTERLALPRDEVTAWATARASEPIDLSQRGYDSVVISHPDGTASWYLALHHAITDATASLLVFDHTAAVYAGGTVELDAYYPWARDRARRDDPRRDRAAAHWAARPPAARVGRLYRPARRPDPASTRVPVPFGDDLADRAAERLAADLAMISTDLGWTVLLVTVAAAYLHRVSGADRFSIGLPVHNRTDAATRQIVGPVMEVFPVDVAVEPDDTYRDLHRRVGRAVMSTLRHAAVGTAPSNADVEAVVNVIPRAGLGAFGDIAAVTQWVHPGASDPGHLFRLQLTTYGGGAELALDINHAVAARRHIARAPGHVNAVLDDLVADPDQPLGARSLCEPAELAVLHRWGTGAKSGRAPQPITATLAARLPHTASVVLRDGDRTWTGPQLWDEVQGTAAWLTELGVGPGRRVGICLPRSAEAVIAMVATLVAGGSYVPLDPCQPEARRSRLAARAGVVTVIDGLDGRAGGTGPGPAGLDDEAYLLFTSGSTGEPKGVPITHLGLARYIEFAVSRYLAPGEAPVVPLFSALTFDLTVTSVFLPLCTGGRIEIVPEDGPAGLRAIADNAELTWIKATPSHLELLVRMLGTNYAVRSLVVGGEAFPARLAKRLADALPAARIFNEYGPTEAVVGCMIHEADGRFADEADVPIGVPAPGVELRVLDRYRQPVPEGAPGELYIAHEGLTAGYLDEEPGTASSFVTLDGVRFYRSGDLVCMVDDRTLTYLGRADEQVKVGGIRLEPNEVADALAAHPAIARAAVRLWSPTGVAAPVHCVRCGLPSDVPGVSFDDAGVCGSCHDYDRIKDQAAAYFHTPEDLVAVRDRARAARTGRYDCIHLLSGGKDSTYALYRLVELGFDVFALTLDNGFISEGAKENIRRSVADLGIDHEFATPDAMAEIFRDSLERHSNVCHGCFKTIYTLGTNRAVELGAPLVVTGLSRGQLFETRLVPAQFAASRFDPAAIDAAVLSARRVYHRVDDAVKRTMDTTVFGDDDLFDRVTFVDFYRYVDVALGDMLAFLDAQAPWVRPRDTGRSTNCLINAAGIHTHRTEQGFHNYAVPYAWDVRLGHKTRDEAIAELDDRLDLGEVTAMLDAVGYQPRPRQVLTAWYELADGATEPSPVELRTFLTSRLPAYAVPQAFVALDQLPVTANGKLDAAMLPAPSRVHRPGPALYVSPQSPLESRIVALWERVLGIEPIGVGDDFFALGGDSLAALEMVMSLSAELGRPVREDLVFVQTTPRDLAAALETDSDVEATGPGAPVRRPAGAEPPLSVAELSILFEQLRAPADPRYHVGRRYRVDGRLDPDRFREALEAVVAAHVPLHWTFVEPRRELEPAKSLWWTAASEQTSFEAFTDTAAALHRLAFDLDTGPLARCLFQPLENGATGIALVFHHISIDAGSFDRLWDELTRRYRGEAVDEPAFDYADHLAWQQAALGDADRAYWNAPERTAPTAAVLLPAPAEPAPGGEYRERICSLDLDTLRSGPAPTAFATALAGIVAVLAAHADGDTIGLGMTASTRNHPGAETLVGYYLNTVPLVVAAPAEDRFADLARRCGELTGQVLAHRTYPFATIVADRRAAGLALPDTRILVAFEELAESSLGGLAASHEILTSGSTIADATFFVQVRGLQVILGVEYATTVLDAAGADRLLAELDEVLRVGVAQPATALGSLPSGTPRATRRAVPAEWNDTARADLAPHTTLDQLIATAAAANPLDDAVVSGANPLSYGELDRRSNQLAHLLVSLGVVPDQPVVVHAPRRPETIVAILAVLRAGGGFVPVDPDQPADRLARIVADCGAKVVLRFGPQEDPDAPHLTIVDLDDADLDRWPATAAIDARHRPEHLAYVVYTSGSTGTPKGVMVEHRQIVASTLARRGFYERDPERFLLLSPFFFDSSMVGLFWTLVSGGTIVLPEVGTERDVVALAALVARHEVTHLLALPSLHHVLADEADPAQLTSLRTVIVAGEACTIAVVDAHRQACPRAELVNEYGPTEAAVWSHAYRVPADHDGPVPIGSPVPNVVGVVLDPNRRPVPVGAVGELYLGGAGVARGYLGRDDLTAERFVDLDGVGRAYRTGDLVSWNDDGQLVFHGRADNQVKVRGYRVEPEEVEATLAAVDGVREVAVVAHGSGREVRLVAYVVAAGPATADGLRQAAAARLPDYLVPATFVLVDEMPRTATGKVDRAALPDPGRVRSTATGAPPSDAEAEMAELWRDALGIDEVGPDDDFFDLGGDSLVAIRIFARIRRRFEVDLPLPVFFEAPTPRALTARIAALKAGATTSGWKHLVPITEGDASRPPLYCVHGLGGNVLNQRGLAVGLGAGWSLVGIQASGVDGLSPLHQSIDEICEAYLAELAAYHPGGPFLLAGYSNGGLIAYELAQRLTTAGSEVAAVVLLDTIHPSHADSHIPLQTHLRELRRNGPTYVTGRVRERRQRAARHASDALLDQYVDIPGVAAPWEVRERRLFAHNKVLLAGYRPRPYAGAVVMMSATDDWKYQHLPVHRGWTGVVPHLEVVRTPGDHVTLLEGANAAVLADNLRPVLERILSSR